MQPHVSQQSDLSAAHRESSRHVKMTTGEPGLQVTAQLQAETLSGAAGNEQTRGHEMAAGGGPGHGSGPGPTRAGKALCGPRRSHFLQSSTYTAPLHWVEGPS